MNASTFSKSILIHRPASETKEWLARPGVAERLTPPWWREENGGAARVFEPAGHACRVKEEGPAACVLTDEVAGAAADDERLARLFAWRHTIVSDDIELLAAYGAVRKMRFVVAGASGLVGRALAVFLRTQGHEVLRLVRRGAATGDELFWNPEEGALDAAALRGVDVVVNLAGEGLAEGRWTASRREAIRGSRVNATRTLVAAVEKLKHRPHLLVNASAAGFYGDRGGRLLDEASPRGEGFLAEVCEAWEREALTARELGLRVALMRFGMVLSPEGGALARLLPLFRGGRGGRLGDGAQWISWSLIDDVVGAIYHAVLSQACDGPVNTASPNPVTGEEFAATLARVLGKTAWLRAPAWALRLKFGADFADELLLASQRMMPERLLDSGFIFRHARLDAALRHVLGK